MTRIFMDIMLLNQDHPTRRRYSVDEMLFAQQP